MHEPLNIHAVGAGPQPLTPGPRQAARRSLLRRLMALLAASTMAFALTTWVMVRFPDPFSPERMWARPGDVVTAHLDAVGRGELRAAYELFSPHYRDHLPFEAYHRLVANHRPMFTLREFRLTRSEEAGERALLETRVVSANGQQYLARFTLIRAEGRWWIDDLHWGRYSPGRDVAA